MNIATTGSFLSLGSLGSGAVVGNIIGSAGETLKEVIDLAFDRLDRTLLVAAEQLQWLIHSLSTDLEGLMDATIDELDEQQRKMIDDLAAFTRQVDAMIDDKIDRVEDLTNSVLTTVQELVTDSPGYLQLVPAVAIAGDDHADFHVRGVNVNRMEMQNVRLGGESIKPEIAEQDGDSLTFRVKLDSKAIAEALAQEADGVLSLRLSFSIAEDGFWPWSKKPGRPFATTLHIFPQVIGTVVAVWSGKVTARETRSFSKTQQYPRLKSRTMGGRRRERRDHSEQPDAGWLFDFNKASFKVTSSDGCNNRASKGVWRHKGAKKLALDVHQVTESAPGKTCYVTSTISAPMYRDSDKPASFESEPADLSMNQRIVLTPPADAAKAEDLQLSHVEITSRAFGAAETTLILPGERKGGMTVELDASSNSAFVSASFV